MRITPIVSTAHPTGRLIALTGGVALSLATSTASATWSILITDTRTGEIAIGSATCVPNINLRSSTPVLILGRGAVTAQSAVDVSGGNRARVFSGFARGLTPDQILADLAANDTGHGNRQYGFIDVDGNALTYSGPQNADWAGGVTGRIDLDPPGPENDLVYAIQGNILTGEPVVLAAESAVINTPGDLAEKLMAGMEAAYAFGGDGRCSCATNMPTACGSPPAEFVKSADVGYMLVGRLGDRDQGGSFDVLASSIGDSLVGDLDGDGLGDIVTFPSFFGSANFRRNVTPNPAGPMVFEETALTGSITAPDAAMLGDVNGDGRTDIVYIDAPNIYSILSNGDGTFQPVASSPLGGVANAYTLGDFVDGGGVELAAVRSNAAEVVTYTFDAVGAATAAATTGLPSQPVGSVATTPTGVALLFTAGGDAIGPYTSDGDGTFTAGTPVPIAQEGPDEIFAGDLNGDGRTDYVYQYTSSRFAALIDGGAGEHDEIPGVFTDPNPETLRRVALTDIDGDGDDDIAGLIRFGRFATLSYDGTSLIESPFRRLLEGTDFSAGDLNSDGLPEIVTAQSSVIGVYANAGSGPPADARGFAGGDYYLGLNVANGPDLGFDDPVLQLRSEFDAWRAGLVGVPDGSMSMIMNTPSRVNVLGSQSGPYTFTVALVDYAGSPAPGADPSSFEIIAPPGQDATLEITGATPLVPTGRWQITAEPTGATGASDLWFRINGSSGPVVIQPAPRITAGLSLADFDLSGGHDLADIVAFVTAYTNSDPAADLDGSGVLDLDDLSLFITEFLSV